MRRGGGAVLATLVVLASLAYLGDADVECPDVIETPPTRIRKKILCGYDRNVRPSTIHTNVTTVSLTMWIRFFRFDPASDSLDIHTWTVWSWNDLHLVWDKTEYEEVQKILLPSSTIWVPDIGLETVSSMTMHTPNMPDTTCHVKSDGKVICVTPTLYAASCVADIARWPFDQHQCTMRVSSSTSNVSQVNLTINYDGIVLLDEAKMDRDWQLLASEGAIMNLSFAGEIIPAINYTFTLKRHSGGGAATVVIPAFVLSLLTLLVFWLDPGSTERLCLICLNILCHCLFMQHLGQKLPNNGDKIPIITLFFRDSLLMVGMSLLISLLVRRMHAASSAAPAWAVALASGALDTLPGQIILTGVNKDVSATMPGDGDDDAPLVGTTPTSRTWRLLATLLDRVAFILFFLTFLILLCNFIP